jgi:6-phosphogluconolactonase (cycloisomerase 2 family)
VGYNFDPNSGKLSPIPGVFLESQDGWANYITVDPVHNVLYQPNFAGSIAVYRVKTGGVLSFLNISGVGQLIAPETLLLDASGSFLFAVGASANYERAPPMVTSFRIDSATGNLTVAGQSQSFDSLNYYSSLAAAP